MGNNLRAVSGMIETREQLATSGTIVVETRAAAPVMGRRYPRAHLQMIVVDAKR